MPTLADRLKSRGCESFRDNRKNLPPMLLTNWLKSIASHCRPFRPRHHRHQRSRILNRYQPALSRQMIGCEQLEDRTMLTGYDLQGHLLPPADSDTNLREHFGSAVAISEDYLVVGAYWNGFHIPRSGLAYVYARDNQGTANDRSDDTWVFETTLSSIIPNSGDRYDHSSDRFGNSVAIEGNTIVVGAPFADASVDAKYENTGAVFVFTKDESGWKNATVTKLISPEADEPYRGSFGWSVALENNTLVVGASLVQGLPYYVGAAYVFTKNASGWENAEVSKLAPSDHPLQAHYGETVAVSGDTIVIGTGDQVSAAYIYSKGIDGWESAVEVKLTGDTPSFGTSVSVRNDTVAIGEKNFSANGYSQNGAVHIYQKGSSWNEYQKTTIQASNPHSGDNFGSSVFLLDDILVIGAKNHPQGGPPQGAVYIYEKNFSGWTGATESFFTSSEIEENNSWGSSIDFNGSEILIGSPLEDANGVDSGAAYIFSNGIHGWNSSEQKISPLTDDIIQHPNDNTGSSVAIDGDYLVAGAPYNNFRGIYAGAAYIYKRNLNGTPDDFFDDFWEYETALFASDGQDYNNFGKDVAIDGNTIVVNGSRRSNENPELQKGSVYIYTKQGPDWNNPTETILKNSDPDFDATFGINFAIDDTQLAVTAMTAPFSSADVEYGAVYVYTNTDNDWLNATKTKIAPENNEGFGVSVDINDDSLIVGSIGDVLYGTHNGSAYIYTKGESGWTDAKEFKFTPDNLNELTGFGTSVSIDGSTVAVGASSDSTYGNRYGAVYVYSKTGSDWSNTVSTKLFGDDGNEYSYYGYSVDIQDNTLVVGEIRDTYPDNLEGGTAYIYKNTGNGWNNSLQTKIKPDPGSIVYDLALDSKTIVIGTPNDTTSQGYHSGSVHVYRMNERSSISINNIQLIESDTGTSSATFTITRKGTSPGDLNQSETIEFKTLDGTASAGIDYSAFGGTIVFQADPNETIQTQTITITIYGDLLSEIDEIFRVMLFNHVGSSSLGNTTGTATIINDDFPELIQSQSVLPPPTLNSTDHFGNDIAVYEDFMVVGAIDSDLVANNAGAAFVYRRNQQSTPDNDSDDTWDYYSTLTAFDAAEGDFFGTSVAIDRGTIVIGAKGDDDLGSESGSAYIFRWIGIGWVFDQKITSSDGEAGDNFGTSVAIEDFTIVVGSPYHDEFNLSYEDEAGAAYVFALVGNAWLESQKITASNKDYYDRFGTAVGINNHQIFVSGITADTGQYPLGGGAVYVFHYSIDTWIERQIIGQPSATGNIWFGLNFYVDDNYLGIISPDDNSFTGGDIYIYKNSSGGRTGTWTFQQQISAPENDPHYSFDSISISGSSLVVGSTTSGSGAVYLYRLIDGNWVESQTLFSKDSAPKDFFGYSVAFSDKQVIVGAPLNDEAGTDVGKFYVFRPYVPEYFIYGVSQDEGDEGQTIFTFNVDRIGQTAGDLNFDSTVDFTTADLSATLADNDYEFKAGTVTFLADQEATAQTQTITLIVNGDMNFEGLEIFRVLLSNPSSGTVLRSSETFVFIEEDDYAKLNIQDIDVDEDAGSATLTVSLDKPSSGQVQIDFTTTDQSALNPDHYLATSGTLIFNAEEQLKTITIPLVNNSIVEADKTFLVKLSNLQSASQDVLLEDSEAVVTIQDDDQSSVSINDVTVDETAGTATLTVSLSQPVETTVDIDFSTIDQSASDPDDYLAQSGTLNFAPGEQSQTITISIVDTNLVEIDETFLVKLTNIQASGANIIFTDDQGEVTIQDDDQANLSISDLTINESAGTASITVTLDEQVDTAISVEFVTSDQSAIAPDDYLHQSDILTFDPGELSKTIEVPIVNSDLVESDESFFVNLSKLQANGRSVNITDHQAEITILDDDQAKISINDLSVDEAIGTATVTVTLDKPVYTSISIDFATADQTAINSEDYLPQSGTLIFNPGEQSKTITVSIADTNLIEADETFLISLSNLQANDVDVIVEDDQSEVTITDNDQAGITINDLSINESAGTATLTVSLDKPVATSVSVDFATADQTAFNPDDYLYQSGTLTFNPNEQTKTITLSIVDSDHLESTETFLVNLTNIQSNGANVIFTDDQAQVTILDDDQAQLSISDLTINEVEGTASVIVSLDKPVNAAVSVDFITADQSALNSVDYLFQSGTLIFDPGEQSKTIDISILDNSIVEGLETFHVNLRNMQTSSPDVILADDQAEITIVDDDQAMFSINDLSVDETAGTAKLKVSLNRPVHTTVSVDFATADNSASNFTDYLSQSGTLTFFPGQQSKFITIPILDSSLVEGTERFFVNLTNIQANGAQVTFADDQSEVTIMDDDQANLSINDLTVNEAVGTATLTVSLDQPVQTSVSVDFSTVDQSAFAPDDYLSHSGTLTFNPNEQIKTITISIIDSDLVELDETFLVKLSNLQTNGADILLIDDQAKVTVIDDDQARITINDISVDEPAGTATVAVSLDQPVDSAVSVDFTTADQSANQTNDYLTSAGTLTFNPGEQSKTITISIVDSDLLERDETFLLNLSNIQAGGRDVIFADDQAEVTIIDDETATARVDLRVVHAPTDTRPNGEVGSLPDSVEWVKEWSSYWVEIWVDASSSTHQGIFSAQFNLDYNTEYTSATEIQFGASFTQNQAGSINDTTGAIEGLFAETNTSDLGSNDHLLFARIKFEPLAEDQVELDYSGKNIGSYDLGFNINSAQVHLFGEIPATTLSGQFDGASIYANPYDLNDDDAINFRDLMLFASVYNTIPSESHSDYSWFADLNQSDRVNFKDLIFFANNYGKRKLDHPTIVYPQNFPHAWNNQLLVDTTQGEPQLASQTLSQSTADTALDSVVEHVSPQLSPSQNETLENVDIQVIDLQGDALGRAVSGTIYIDADAAGYGWFVDTTPGDNSEFQVESQLSLIALPDTDAAGRVDLWSVIMHELGHLLGFEHENEGLMQDTLPPGVRRLPSWELNIDLENNSLPEEADSFFFTIQDQTELVPF